MGYISKPFPTNIKLLQKFQPNSPHPIRLPTRPIRPMTTPSTLHPAPSFSAGSDTASLQASLSYLLHPNGRWKLTPQRNGLERPFKFKTFKKTWDFMNAVAEECKVKKHHPEWSNVYNTAFVRWTTHSPPGLSAKDVEMARFCDEQAGAFGEVVPEEREREGHHDIGRELADRVAVEGGDCCVPKPKAQA